MPECLVIGGGLAGAMAGLRLAARGCAAVLIEKEREPHHKVCGEFLSPEAILYLRQAGVDPLRLGAVPVRRLRLSARNRTVETALPFTALSLSRRVLDEALLECATEQGCNVRRGLAVENLSREAERWAATLSSGETITAPAVFLATGKHDLRGWARAAGAQNDLVGFKLHCHLSAAQTRALEETMELFLFRGGYGGLCLIEQEIANLCLVVRKSTLRRLGGWSALLDAILTGNRRMRACLDRARPLQQRPLAISSIPYGYLLRHDAHEGLWPIGDQAAVIPSFTGDGMSIALHSGALAAASFLAGESPGDYQQTLARQLRSGIGIATWLSRAAVASIAGHIAPLLFASLPGALSRIASATRIPSEALLVAEPASSDAAAVNASAKPSPVGE